MSNEKKLNLIKRAEAIGYYYDEVESYKGYLRFTYALAAMPLVFKSWKELENWLNAVEFDF